MHNVYFPPPPRPNPQHSILKRAASDNHPSSPREVHFPPSPRLSRTFSAHSSSSYDRTPIEVATNVCALPARGCPGRTYYDCDKKLGGPRSPTPSAPLRGHLHPRALARAQEQQGCEDYEEDDDGQRDQERTPTRTSPYIPLPVPPPIPQPPYSQPSQQYTLFYPPYPYQLPPTAPPPLVPDLSSESDESDGFTSPPPEPAFVPTFTGGKYEHHKAYSYPSSPYGYPTASPYVPSYMSAPPSPPLERERRRRARRPSRSPRRSGPADGYEEEDLPVTARHSPSASPPHASVAGASQEPRKDKRDKEKDKERKDRKDKCRVGALCRSFKGVGFQDGSSDGCLGGF
ncbi:hypothetical protein FB45DRAFT_1062744 [Roridomyces roridus]|uniref:Uncharacterized protein n=1 Tax=Roridomyces roridus TaxID=1738132 RepID=A0AAD7FGL2_9AGAR|nr:hypothetical protein FB45DRAFT_1062744 [Roridomyces roridus]